MQGPLAVQSTQEPVAAMLQHHSVSRVASGLYHVSSLV